MTAYKFVKWDVPALKDLAESRIYKAIEAAEAGNLKPLKQMYTLCGFGVDSLLKGYYKLQGWYFDISKYCKTFLVRFKNDSSFYQYMAPNKTCLYSALGGRHLLSECIEKPIN